MHRSMRSLAVLSATTALALTGAGAAYACDGSPNTSGTYPGEMSGTYPGETTTTSTTTSSSTTATSAGTRQAARHARRHARRA